MNERDGVSRFSVENFLLTVENFRRGILYCCLFSGYRKILERRGVRSIKIFRRRFLSHSAENFCRGILFCCINFESREILCFRGLCHDFRSKFFCLTVPKNFVEEHFCAVFQKNSGSEKVCIRGGGEYQYFRRFFLSHSAEKFRRGILCGCINFGNRKNLDKRGGGESQDFRRIFFCLTVPQISIAEPFIVALKSGTEKVWIREGSIKIIRRIFFVS